MNRNQTNVGTTASASRMVCLQYDDNIQMFSGKYKLVISHKTTSLGYRKMKITKTILKSKKCFDLDYYLNIESKNSYISVNFKWIQSPMIISQSITIQM